MSDFVVTLTLDEKIRASLESYAKANGRTLNEQIATKVQFPCSVTIGKPIIRRRRRRKVK